MNTHLFAELPIIIARRMAHAAMAISVAAALCLIASSEVHAQSASGSSTTRCDQTGRDVVCVTTTRFTLPAGGSLGAGTGLSNFVFGMDSLVAAPTCSSYVANPQAVPVGIAAPIALSATCSAGSLQSWSGVQSQSQVQNNSSATDNVTLLSGGSKTYTLTACAVAQPTRCTSYVVTITAQSAPPPQSLGSCTITPASGSLVAGASPTLSVSCAQGTPTRFQWSLNTNEVTGATDSTFKLPASATVPDASLFVSVELFNGFNSQTPYATYAVPAAVTPPATGTCKAGAVANKMINYSDGYVALNNIEMGGAGAMFVLGLNVAANDTSANRLYLPVYGAAQSPVTPTASRTVSVSECPGDFSNAIFLISESPDFVINFTTEPWRVGPGVALLQPGRQYYVNVRNDTCRAGAICSMDGQYRNWGY